MTLSSALAIVLTRSHFMGFFVYRVNALNCKQNSIMKTILKKRIEQSYSPLSSLREKSFYRLLVIFYAVYLVFSPNVFALRAEAPEKDFLSPEDELVYAPEISPLQLKNDEEILRIKREKSERREEVRKIRKYFKRYHLPLADQAELFIESAHRYGIDWRLLAAIGFIESTGGKYSCGEGTHNAFGWHSCKKHFSSYQESIDFISKNLAGKYESTARYYRGKSVRGILEAYNPPSVVPDYADKVMREMRIISSM